MNRHKRVVKATPIICNNYITGPDGYVVADFVDNRVHYYVPEFSDGRSRIVLETSEQYEDKKFSYGKSGDFEIRISDDLMVLNLEDGSVVRAMVTNN